MKTMHLFAGAGGGLLSDLINGHEPIIAVEWEPYACQVLRERAAEGWFPDLQVYEGDVRLFDPSEYTGRVDCIHAGFPCQDISNAGKQAGVGEETRSGLYREVLRIADVVRPQYIFLENVSAILSNGLGTVLGDLASRCYDARWICVRASDVGANHQRDRWWLLAKQREEYGYGYEQYSKHERDRGILLSDIQKEYVENQKMVESKEPNGESGRIASNVPGDIRTFSREADQPSMVGVAGDAAFWVDESSAIGNCQVPLQAAVAFKILEGMIT